MALLDAVTAGAVPACLGQEPDQAGSLGPGRGVLEIRPARRPAQPSSAATRDRRHLLNLRAYIAPEVTGWQCHDADALRIVPVQAKRCSTRPQRSFGSARKIAPVGRGLGNFWPATLLSSTKLDTVPEQQRDKAEGRCHNDR